MPTPKQQLLEMLYDGDLTADIAVMVATPLSWREIAARVSARSGHTVSHETMRNWYGLPTEQVAS